MDYTVNELLVLKSSLTSYKVTLERRMSECIRRRTDEVRYGDNEVRKTTDEPRFDSGEIDKRITEINLALFDIDRAIKVANAKTMVNVNVDIRQLISPLTPLPFTQDK